MSLAESCNHCTQLQLLGHVTHSITVDGELAALYVVTIKVCSALVVLQNACNADSCNYRMVDCWSYRGPTTASPARQEATRAATGPAAGTDATAKSASTANQPSQSSQPAAETAKRPGAKLDEQLFTLGNCFQIAHHHSHACTCCSPLFRQTASCMPFSRLLFALQMTCLQRMAGAPLQSRGWQISKLETIVRMEVKAAAKCF